MGNINDVWLFCLIWLKKKNWSVGQNTKRIINFYKQQTPQSQWASFRTAWNSYAIEFQLYQTVKINVNHSSPCVEERRMDSLEKEYFWTKQNLFSCLCCCYPWIDDCDTSLGVGDMRQSFSAADIQWQLLLEFRLVSVLNMMEWSGARDKMASL